MNKKQSILALIIPSLGALALFGWSIGYPFVYSIISGDLSNFPDFVVYINVCIMMFGVPAWVWVALALASFTAGFWFVFNSVRQPQFKGAQVLGLVLTVVPLVVIGLAPCFADYYGP